MTVPPEAIELATVAVHDVDCPDKDCNGSALGHACKLAKAALEAAAPYMAAAERERWTTTLTEHYLMAVICGDDTGHPGQDNPVCGCSRVFLGWHPSMGAARDAWIAHVVTVLAGDQP